MFDFLLALLGSVDGADPALAKSMKRSKTLTIMVIVGMLLFGGFILFLVHMTGKQG